ncbi:hypothetical protein [Chromobacterium piscinae]|uniref:hypothetical protein n=1 Tax=Chromobacterium piscinae TaxID=686831 RepID=UPI003F7DE2F5
MNYSKAALAAIFAIPMYALAISKPYDAVAGAVMRDGTPCFYSLVPLSAEPPGYLRGMGISLRLFNESPRAPGYLWDTWFKTWTRKLPTSPATCVPYSIASPDKTPRPPQALRHDEPLSFSFGGEWGRQNVRFCIRKDDQGHDYLTKVVRHNGVAACTAEPLKNDQP